MTGAGSLGGPPRPPVLTREQAAELTDIVGSTQVLTDAGELRAWGTDFTGRFSAQPRAVVRPGSTGEVAQLVAWCRGEQIALVAQGGNTGLVGGGVALRGELCVSLRRLTGVSGLDAGAGQLTAGAGETVGEVQRHAREMGWAYGVDFAARDSATIGGSIATNAGGLRFLRYGGTRQQLLGVEAVLGNGLVISHLGGLAKDNTGYDLAGLLCGSEGTLGVVTRARLRLVPRGSETVTAVVGFDAIDAAVAATGELRRGVGDLEVAEVMFADGVALVREAFQVPMPFADPPPVWLLVEAVGREDPAPALAQAVAGLDGVRDVAVASDPSGRDRLWRLRELHTEAINRRGAPHKLDVTLPTAALADFLREVPEVVRDVEPDAEVWLFGHVGDGNVHVNLTGVAPDDERADDAVLRHVAALGGSISAEHGIGTAKTRWLALTRTDEELAAFRAVKAALDPDGICNPNALLA